MKEQTHQVESTRTWILGILAVILVSWLGWISRAVIELQEKVAVIDYKLFGLVAKVPEKHGAPQLAGTNIFQFLERKTDEPNVINPTSTLAH